MAQRNVNIGGLPVGYQPGSLGIGIDTVNLNQLRLTLSRLTDGKDINRKGRMALLEAAQPMLPAAKAGASAIADTGAFSRSIRLIATATSLSLRSSDPGAGVMEYAHPGAVARRGPNKGKPVGVPAGVPSRALWPAVDRLWPEVEQHVVDAIDSYIQDYIDYGTGR